MRKISLTYCIFFILNVLTAFSSLAQEVSHGYQNIIVNTFGFEDGLNTSTINAILQDTDGMIWLGTDEGLNRFDGHEFKLFQKGLAKDSSQISGNTITSMVEDKNGMIWIGTSDGGVSIFDRKREKFRVLYPDPDDLTTLSNHSILCLFLDDDYVWIGTYWGLNKVNIHDFSIEQGFYDNKRVQLYQNQYSSIIKDEKSGRYWLGTFQGLLYRDEGDTTIKVPTFIKGYDQYIRNLEITDLHISDAGILYIAHKRGFTYINISQQKIISLKSDDILPGVESIVLNDIEEDSNGDLLVATDGNGVLLFNVKEEKFDLLSKDERDGLQNLPVDKVYLDQSNRLWIGTINKGLVLVSEFNKKFELYTGFDDNHPGEGLIINSFVEDKQGIIWVSTYRQGLYKFDPKTKEITRHKWNNARDKRIDEFVIKTMELDDKGNIYLGTYVDGLIYLDVKTNRTTYYLPDPKNPYAINCLSIWDMEFDKNGNLWLGTLGEGLTVFNPKEQKFYEFNFENTGGTLPQADFISKIHASGDEMWIGTIGSGFSIYNMQSKIFTNYPQQDTVDGNASFNEVMDLFEDSRGQIWLGTKGFGLFEYDRETKLMVQHKLFEDISVSVTSVTEDINGSLWLGTFKGLVKYNPDQNTTVVFDPNDGIQSLEFNTRAKLRDHNGDLYFGGNNGFNVFNPEEIKMSDKIPKVVLTDLRILNQPVDLNSGIINKHINYTNKIILQPHQKVFSIAFAALDYVFPKKNQFSYMLEGFDNSWNYPTNSRTATYTNLPQGTYTFKVKASNHDGIWGENTKVLQLVILPSWYEQAWARVLLISVLFNLVIFLIWMRTKFIFKQKRLLEDIVNERTIEIKKQKSKIELKNNELDRKNKAIRESNIMITHQNDELMNKNEEIHAQRFQLDLNNQLLQKAHIELKSINKQLIEANQNLEGQVKERTKELESTLEKLIKSDEEINTFLYKSSHDLRGPITTLMGLTNLARIENKDKNIDGYLQKIDLTCHNMLSFLEKLNETKVLFKLKFEKELVDFEEIVGSVKSELRKEYPKKSLSIALHLDPQLEILSDKELLHAIILNLAESSIKSFHKEKSKLEINIYRKSGGVQIDFDIQDEIIEFNAEILNLLNRTDKLSVEGGMGLFLANRAVELLNGEIEYKPTSTVVFQVKLPLKVESGFTIER